MNHDAFQDRLLDLAYGELSPRETREVEAHAETCPGCRAALARIRGTRRLASALPLEPAPERGEAILVAAAREAIRARARPRRTLPPWLWAGSLATVALLAVAAVSYRILALRPGPLAPPEAEVLLGSGRTPAEPAPPPTSAPAVEPTPASPAIAAPAQEEEARRDRAKAPSASSAAGAAPAERKAVAEEKPEAKPLSQATDAFAGARVEAPAPPPPSAAPAAPPLARPEAAQVAGAAGAAPEQKRAQGPGLIGVAPEPARSRALATADTARVEDPLERHRRLRDAGRLRAEAVVFQACPGEAWRKVETDPEGRVVAYLRGGTLAGKPFEAELYYGEDGALGAARFRAGEGPWSTYRLPAAPGADVPAPLRGPTRAEEATLAAPPRCE
ncbi:MAG TPA: zf-HC2 domain-containing protein [Anaeromyxobacter sp.]|nr:zf-HC2 domain-containing protein [Anaeromyxobacter sp.]